MRDVQCRTCVRIHQGYCDGAEPDDMNRPCEFYKRMTNGDRIRAMTDEELADEFSYSGCHKQSNPEICRKHTGECERCWLDWLKKEVSE